MLYNDAQNVHISPEIYYKNVNDQKEYFHYRLIEREIYNGIHQLNANDYDLNEKIRKILIFK